MKFLILIFLSLLMTKGECQQTKKFIFKDYLEASKSQDTIRFQMVSTKMGLITTSFKGYAKNFEVSYELLENSLKWGKVLIFVKDLDTDVKGRNKKMWNYCLEETSYQQIEVSFQEVPFNEEKEIPAKITIRGKQHDLLLKIKIMKDDKGLMVTGKSQVGLKELEIPDPSILVARVKNEVDIEFNLTLLR